MNYKKQIRLILFISVLFSASVIVMEYIRGSGDVYFSRGFRSYWESMFWLPLAIFISTIPLLFLKEKVYKAWRTFALFAIPLSLLWIFLTPIHGSGGILATGREYITFLVSGLFLAISYILIIYKAWRYRN